MPIKLVAGLHVYGGISQMILGTLPKSTSV